jgi:hypothetical protein
LCTGDEWRSCAEGFPLDVIRRMLDRSAESAPDVRCLASEVFDPANPTTSMELKRADLADHHVASVQALVGLYREEVWTPFVKSGLPTEQWHTIADKTTQLRPLAIGLGSRRSAGRSTKSSARWPPRRLPSSAELSPRRIRQQNGPIEGPWVCRGVSDRVVGIVECRAHRRADRDSCAAEVSRRAADEQRLAGLQIRGQQAPTAPIGSRWRSGAARR